MRRRASKLVSANILGAGIVIGFRLRGGMYHEKNRLGRFHDDRLASRQRPPEPRLATRPSTPCPCVCRASRLRRPPCLVGTRLRVPVLLHLLPSCDHPASPSGICAARTTSAIPILVLLREFQGVLSVRAGVSGWVDDCRSAALAGC